MNISSISVNNFKYNQSAQKYPPKVSDMRDYSRSSSLSVQSLPKNYYLSFKGGYSLNLLQTMHNFEEMEAMKGEQIVPSRVREVADFVLDAGNTNNLTLIDVHKKAYEDMKTSESLEEVKVRYPEFEDVLSVEELNVRKDSLISDAKAGKCPIFSKDEDLSLQLLKLYWADGFSLSDIEKHTNGKKNIAYAMERLNIPRLDSHYGHILKFSDKEYNARIAQELALKRIENHETKHGHVFIPKGALPKEQRDKISASLIEYYIKHPERAYLQSVRQKEFYKNNPEAAELFSLVVSEAWKLSSSKPVKDALSKFLTGKGRPKSENSKFTQENLSVQQSLLMNEFWAKHPYAKDKFSVSLKCAWKRIRELKAIEETKIDTPIPAYPLSMQNKIKNWADNKGYNSENLNFNLTTFVGDSRRIQSSKSAQVIKEYFESNPVMADVYADSLAYSLAVLRDHLLMPEHRSVVGDKVIYNIERGIKGKRSMAVKELLAIYVDVVKTLISNDRLGDLGALCRYMENCYNHVVNIRRREGYPLP